MSEKLIIDESRPETQNHEQPEWEKVWEIERERYLAMMQNTNNVIDEILGLESRHLLIDDETERQIKEKQRKLGIYQEKLDKNIFELSIVGLENSGKSTFANALILNDILPAASARCTFTSTQLEHGNDKAVVEFYKRDEFNQMFQEMLKNIEYEKAESLDFEFLPLHKFEEYFKSLEEFNWPLHKASVGRIDQDIRDIIEGKDIIKKYLGSPNVTFEGSNIRSAEFREFITDPTKSRPVKRITIQSSELGEMKNMVIFDVPGFDSPYKLHEEQTIERLRKADGIVLITNVGDKPNLTGSQLNVLLRESDHDGIKLNDKLFIFGNKIDTTNTKEEAKANSATLRNDAVKKYKIVRDNRLLIGSAYAYLQKKHLIRGGGDVISKLEQYGLNDNIELMKDALEEYYKTERFRILKTQINKNIEDVKQLFQQVIKQKSKELASKNFTTIDRNRLLGALREAKEIIGKELSLLGQHLSEDIIKQKRFTERFKGSIGERFQTIEQGLKDLIEEVTLERRIPGIPDNPLTVNIGVREKLYPLFLDTFTNIMIGIADTEAEKIAKDFVEAFSKALRLTPTNPYYDQIRQAISELIEEFTKEESYNRKSFVLLIQRFSRDITDILISQAFGTNGREETFKQAEADYMSLAMYADDYMPENPSYMQPFIAMILAHQTIMPSTKKRTGFFEEFKNKIRDTLKSIQFLTKDENLVDSISQELEKQGKDPEMFNKMLAENLPQIEAAVKNNRNDIALRIVKHTVENCPTGSSVAVEQTLKKEVYYERLMLNLRQKQASSFEDVEKEILKDIAFLSLFLRTAVIKAINLEKPFAATFNQQIVNLRLKRDSKEFDEFVSKWIDKIRYAEVKEDENQNAVCANLKKILEKMQEFVVRLENQGILLNESV